MRLLFSQKIKLKLLLLCFTNVGIFIIANNKNYESYLIIFSFIERYILTYINNEIINIKWISFTSNFEITLISAFKKCFDFFLI